jgi:signal transduction histidine kinase
MAVGGAVFGWYSRFMARLEQQRRAQEAFARQLIISQENERKRIAGELHDGLGQDLLLIKNRLGLLVGNAEHSPEVAVQLAEITSSASRAIADVRSISQALRPSALEQVGITRAIEWMVTQVSQATPARFSTELDTIDGLLPPETEINLYRIVQEALNNAVKHSRASEVIVQVKREPAGLFVSVFDDGQGFDSQPTPVEKTTRDGFGLAGMKERAKVLGGRLDIHSAPGKGTRLVVTIPLQGTSNANKNC